MGIPPTITNAVQTTQTWLNELCENGELADTSEAVAVLRCVLHQLRDRLTLEEAVDLSTTPFDRPRDVFRGVETQQGPRQSAY